MRKITWDWISIELTRKCQLKCRHCFRGKAQDKTISLETLDNWLKHTEIIGMLHFTGGEPTIAIEQMEFIADKLREYGIPLFRLQLVTNGYEKSERFVEVIKKFSEIIKISNMYEENFKVNRNITICVSCDRYHKEQNYDPLEAVSFYKERLKGYAKVSEFYDGNLPSATGNGKTLPEALNIKFETDKIPRQVEYLTKEHKPMCPYARTYNLIHENQIYVVCEMYMDVHGRLLTYDKSQGDSITNDKVSEISNMNTTTDILEDIKKFNVGKMCCLDRMKLTQKEQTSEKVQIKMYQEAIKSNIALAMQGYEGNNTYDAMVELFADKHVFGKSNNADVDPSKYIDISPLSLVNVTEEQIDNYKKEILTDNEVYTYDVR